MKLLRTSENNLRNNEKECTQKDVKQVVSKSIVVSSKNMRLFAGHLAIVE